MIQYHSVRIFFDGSDNHLISVIALVPKRVPDLQVAFFKKLLGFEGLVYSPGGEVVQLTANLVWPIRYRR